MTTNENLQEEKETPTREEPELEELKFFIDPSRAKELGCSLEYLIFTRRCSSCRTSLEDQKPLPSPAKQIKEVAKHCAKEEGFIRSTLPFQEILFRTLLAEGNRHMSLAELHYVITEQWATPIRPMNIKIEDLKRILEADTFYCFNQAAEKGI